jgi:mannose-1-phosphate guanylyltransferase
MFQHTYTFTIDRIPLVLENCHFTGINTKYKGIIEKKRHLRKQNCKSTEMTQEAQPETKFGPIQSTTTIQAHSKANRAKEEPRGPSPGAAALGARPRPYWHASGPPRSGGSLFNAR